jgi:hypothetical protein
MVSESARINQAGRCPIHRMIGTAEERAVFDSFSKSWDGYQEASPRAIRLS